MRRGFTSLLIRLVPAAAALTAAALAGPALDAPAWAQPATAPVTPSCAWTAHSAASDNVLAPDSAATYYLLPFTAQAGLRIRLSGRYPDARYASLQAYDAGGSLFTVNGVSSALTDYQIQPERGSVNPWQPRAWPGRRRPAGGRFPGAPGPGQHAAAGPGRDRGGDRGLPRLPGLPARGRGLLASAAARRDLHRER